MGEDLRFGPQTGHGRRTMDDRKRERRAAERGPGAICREYKYDHPRTVISLDNDKR